MRIAIIAPDGLPIPPVSGGSVQIYLSHLLPALAEHCGADLHLLSPAAAADRAQEGGLGDRVVHWRAPERADQARYADWVTTVLAELQPDVVQVDNRPLLVDRMWRAGLRAPVILNLHSTTFLGPRHVDPPAARRILRQVHGVVCNSHYLRRTVAERFRLRDGTWRPHVIYPGVDAARWQRAQPATPSPNGPWNLAFMGRVIDQKGVHVLLRAVRRLRQAKYDVHLVVIGRAPSWQRRYEAQLHRLAAGLPVTWVGFVPPDELPDRLTGVHAVVVPSQSNEAFGLVNLEAMAAGIPVVASAIGGIPEVVARGSGVLVRSAGDPAAFARAIRRLLANPERWTAVQRQARRRAAAFTWERTARAFAACYATVWAGGEAAPR